jgi:hypothetical protein
MFEKYRWTAPAQSLSVTAFLFHYLKMSFAILISPNILFNYTRILKIRSPINQSTELLYTRSLAINEYINQASICRLCPDVHDEPHLAEGGGLQLSW